MFNSFTPHTVTDTLLFRSHVLSARTLGHWITEQQLDIDLRGVAVALRDRKGEARGAIGMTVQAVAYSRGQMEAHLLPLLNEAAQALRPLL